MNFAAPFNELETGMRGGLISGDQQVRLWLGMLLFVGCSFRNLFNSFCIHRGDFFDSVSARVLGFVGAVIKRR